MTKRQYVNTTAATSTSSNSTTTTTTATITTITTITKGINVKFSWNIQVGGELN